MKFLYAGMIFLIFLAGCRSHKHPNVSEWKKERKILRLDQDLFKLDVNHPEVEKLHSTYGHFLDIYMEGVLQLGAVADSSLNELLALFVQDSLIREIQDSVTFRFPDLKVQEKDLSEAFAYYAYYFPNRAIPQVYSYISGFNQSVIVDSGMMGVSLDNYLGDCVFYDMLAEPIPKYARKKMTGDDIVRDLLGGWLSVEFPFYPQKNDLISGMIYQGKMVYLLKNLLPDYEIRRIFGFTKEQLGWCEGNEEQVWSFLVKNEYLFSTQQKLILKYLNDAPYTSGMPVESPGKTCTWTGFRIVDAYVERTGESLENLMKEQDYHKILRVSLYRP